MKIDDRRYLPLAPASIKGRITMPCRIRITRVINTKFYVKRDEIATRDFSHILHKVLIDENISEHLVVFIDIGPQITTGKVLVFCNPIKSPAKWLRREIAQYISHTTKYRCLPEGTNMETIPVITLGLVHGILGIY
jgi:hypothetical protein